MEKKNPELTINKFAEYLSASNKKKLSILKTIKFADEGYKRNRYNSAKSTIVNYLIDVTHDFKIFENTKQTLLNKKVETQWLKNDRENTLLAIKNLEICVVKVLQPYIHFNAQRVNLKEIKRVNIYGVQIDLNPD